MGTEMLFLLHPLSWKILLGSAIFSVILFVYLTWNFDYWQRRGVPYIKPLPVFGNIKDLVLGKLSDGQMYKRIYDMYKGYKYVGSFQFRGPTLVLRDPDIIKDVLVKNFHCFHDRGIPVDEETQPLSAHLISLSGVKWRALRSKLTPTFTSGKMKMMYHLIAECSEELRRHLHDPARKGEELEMRDEMAKFTTDVIGSCVFGLQTNSMKDSGSEFRRIGRKVFEASLSNFLRRFTVIFLHPIAKWLKIGIADNEVKKFFLGAVKETIDYREKNNIIRNDFMQLLIQLKHNGKLVDEHEVDGDSDVGKEINLTDNLLAAQAFVFFLAGFETSSTLLSFTLYELALNPDIQQRLREENENILKKCDGSLSYGALSEMLYLDQVISESLRKYPPIGTLMRVCTKPYTIPGTDVVITEGARLVVPVLGIHNDSDLYPDPERFDPDRFNEENKSKRQHFTYLPFGEGPRICIGMRFGLLQAKLALATLLRDYQFSPSEHTVIPLRHDPRSIVTASRDGIHLRISSIN